MEPLTPSWLSSHRISVWGKQRLGTGPWTVKRGGSDFWTLALARHQNGCMRPRASRPDALQSVTVLEALEGLAAQHGAAGVPFTDLETATRSRMNYRALTDALNALVNEGAVQRVTEKPARLTTD